MNKSSYSIKQRIWLVATIVLLLMSAVVYWSAALYAERLARNAFDRQLRGAALQMAESVNLVGGDIEIDLPLSAFELLAMSEEDRAFYAIRHANGTLLTGYNDVPFPPDSFSVGLLHNGYEWIYDDTYSGELVRFVTLQKRLLDSNYDSYVLVTVGQTVLARKAHALQTKRWVIQFVVAFFAISLLLIILGVWLALRPLKKVRMELLHRSSVDLSAISLAVPKEISPLTDAINQLMAQLNQTLDRLKHFSNEAAHQLRTPLAGLRSEAQSALDESNKESRDEQLRNVIACSDQLASMVTHTLQHAELAHRFQRDEIVQVDLTYLTLEVAREVAATALEKNVELSYIGQESPAYILGNMIALRFMISNILENAVKYSPANSEVGINLEVNSMGIRLAIADHGEGISDSEKTKVFELHYRSPNNLSSGTGIGLSIAKEVADFHHATIELLDNQPTGLVVSVVFSKLGEV